MGELTVATTSHRIQVRRCLEQTRRLMLRDGLLLRWSEQERAAESRFVCSYEETGDSGFEILIYHIASALGGIINGSFIEQWVPRLLKREGMGRTSLDRNRLRTRVTRLLLTATWMADHETTAQVMEFLVNHDFIHLEGFADFRLGEYVQRSVPLVTQAIAELNGESVCGDIVQLLRCFVESADSYVDRIDVFVHRSGRFRLMDESGDTIDHGYMSRYLSDISADEVDLADLLVSTLILLAPLELHLYCEADLPVVDVIRDVFQERVTFHRA
ncbi:MAG: sporulation protein YtxC [Limnochordia bacterium]